MANINLSNKTVKELRELAKLNGVKYYSRMDKATLVETLTKALETKESIQTSEPEQTTMFNSESEQIKEFVPKYKNGVRIKYVDAEPTYAQIRYLKSLEANYDFKVDESYLTDRLTTSRYISHITRQINAGQIVKRPASEAKTLIRNIPPKINYTLVSDNQLEYIKKLEQETGVKVDEHIVYSSQANRIINELLEVKRKMKFEKLNQPKTENNCEVAVDRAEFDERFIELGKKVKQTKNENFSFKDALKAFFRRFI